MAEQVITVNGSELRVGDAIVQQSSDSAFTITRVSPRGEYGFLVYTEPHGQVLREYLSFERVLVIRKLEEPAPQIVGVGLANNSAIVSYTPTRYHQLRDGTCTVCGVTAVRSTGICSGPKALRAIDTL